MKRENQEKKEREMKKFKFMTGDNNDDGDDLLEELGGLEDDELEEPEIIQEEPDNVDPEEPMRYFNE